MLSQWMLLPFLPVVLLFNDGQLDDQSGAPFVEFFSADQIGNDHRIFSVACDGDGLIYLAHPDAHLVTVYDGDSWTRAKIEQPLALATDTRGVVWVGSGAGAGYFKKNRFNQFEYTPYPIELNAGYPKGLYFALPTDEGVRLGNSKVVVDIDTTASLPSHTVTFANVGETLVGVDAPKIVSKQEGFPQLNRIDGDRRSRITDLDFSNYQLDTVIQFSDGTPIYITDGFTQFRIEKDNKLVPFSNSYRKFNEEVEIRWILPFGEQRLGMATSERFTCFDSKGEILFTISSRQGIKGDVRRFGTFRDGRVWVTSSEGFGIGSWMSGFKCWPILSGRRPPTYQLKMIDESLFVASPSGLFEVTLMDIENLWIKGATRVLPTTTSAVTKTDKQKIAATSIGLFLLDEDRKKKPKKLASGIFVDSFFDADSEPGNGYFFAVDQHLNLIVYRAGSEQFQSVNQVGLPYPGKMRARVGEFQYLFAGRGGRSCLLDFSDGISGRPAIKEVSTLESPRRYHYIDDKLHSTSKYGIHQFEFTDGKPQFKKSEVLDGDWSFVKTEFVLIDCDSEGLAVVDLLSDLKRYPKRNGKISDEAIGSTTFGFPYSVDHLTWDRKNRCLWTMVKKNLVRVDLDFGRRDQKVQPVHTRMSSNDWTSQADDKLCLQPAGGISFQFGLPYQFFPMERRVAYQYKLVGLDQDWSPWLESPRKEYTNLAGGDYSFQVRARYPDGRVSEIEMSDFSVETPWYQQSWAKIFSIVAMSGFFYFALVFFTRGLKRANDRMEKLVEDRTKEIVEKSQEILDKSAQLHAKELKGEAERLQSFDTLVAGIAHDFNNLLTVILTNNEMISISGDESSKKFAKNSLEAIHTAISLCGEMSAFSDKSPTSLKPVDMVEAVSQMKKTLSQSVPREIEFRCSLPDKKLFSLCEVVQLERAMLNLVVNAGEAARSKVQVRIRSVELGEDDLLKARFIGNLPGPGEFHCVEVNDDGSGFEPAVLNRIFDPFFSTKKFGRGLGLAIVLKIIGRHQGVVFVNTGSSGTTFSVCLPKTELAESKIPKPHLPIAMKKLTVLVVDDEQSVLESIRQLLISQNHQVVSTSDPTQALTSVLSERFDLIILDVVMPELTGPELAVEIIRKAPETPILLVSGFNESYLDSQVLERGKISFLAKPFSRSQLDSAIRDLLGVEAEGSNRVSQIVGESN